MEPHDPLSFENDKAAYNNEEDEPCVDEHSNVGKEKIDHLETQFGDTWTVPAPCI